jgi:hypothetical protein
MNLRNRLKKLEHSVIDDSTVCECYPRYIETYIQDLGEDAPLDNQPVLTSEPVPDVCPNCRKRTEKKSITVQLVDGTTKKRFPDQWKAN